MPPNRFNAEISAGSLMVLESRRVASLMLSEPDEQTWTQRIEVDNILQKNTPSTARRQARLIRRRLETMDEEAWRLIAHDELEVATQLLLACSIKHSALFGDFMLNVYADRVRRLEVNIEWSQWESFLDHCSHIDATVTTWTEATKRKLFQVIVRMLVEAKLLDGSRTRRLTLCSLHPTVRRLLRASDDTYVLDCLDRT